MCRHCGAEEQPPAAVGVLELLDESSRLCPACAVPLSNSRLEGHPLLSCTICLGMLIEMNRFVAIIESVRAHVGRSVQTMSPRRQNPEDRALACPACGRPMVAHLYGGPGNVVIDTCERCLVNWLDSAELRRIAVAPDRPRST